MGAVQNFRIDLIEEAQKNFQVYVINETFRNIRNLERKFKLELAALDGKDADSKLEREVLKAELNKLSALQTKTEKLKGFSEMMFEAQLSGKGGLSVDNVISLSNGDEKSC